MPITRTPLIDDDGTGTTGTIINNAWQTGLYNQIDAFVSNGGVWSTYAPNWGGIDAIGPTLNNGILLGRYLQIGKWVDLAIILKMGSTTSFGSSTFWYWTLPFTPRVNGSNFEITFRAGAQAPSGSTYSGLTGFYFGTGVLVTNAAGAVVNPTTPFTWSAGGILSIRGSYELP